MKPFPGILRSRWLACPVSILALFGLTWFVWPKPAGSGLTVQFAGLVGGWSPARFAIFSVSNMTSRSISFVTGNPQLGTGGVWSQGIVWPTSASGAELRVGQFTNYLVAVPTNACNWRLPVTWCYKPDVSETIVARSKSFLRAVKEGRRPGLGYDFAVTSYTNFSAGIEFVGTQPGSATNPTHPSGSYTNREPAAAGPGDDLVR